MKKSLLLLVLCFLFSLNLVAQVKDFYYTFDNSKVVLTKISGKLLAEFPNGLDVVNSRKPSDYPGIKLTDKTYIVENVDSLAKYNAEFKITPTYLTFDGQELNYTREVLLKFKRNVSIALKAKLIASKKLIMIKTTPSYEMYQTADDALQVSKDIYLTGHVEFCTPDFISKVDKLDHIPNDSYFNKQWYLHNTGQGTNDGKTTTIDANIDAPEAWDISKGNSNVIVAIVDEGVTSNHPDLPNNRQLRINGSNFAHLFDGTNNPNDPSPTVSSSTGNNHGNACAGIVGATQDNNEGISGIAPLCKIMPIKIPFGTVAASVYADAINFAVTNNADIISNSWGYSSSNPNLHPVIVSAINNAINNNKIVVFAAGNTANKVGGNVGYVTFPGNAAIPNLITVGASDRNNNQANYSPKGSDLEIVAPSHSGYNSQIKGESFNVWTIDIPGSNLGYNSWKDLNSVLPVWQETLPNAGVNFTSYTGRMGGTSAATPMIAGVLALMKSINSCLSVSQMKNILQSSADKIGGFNYNWNPSLPGHSLELGYGKVNAYKAVQMAQSMIVIPQITGLDFFCTSANYSVSSSGATTFAWTITQGANLVTLSGNGTANVTLTALPNASGIVTLSLTLGGTCGNVTINKTMWVGLPSVPQLLTYSNIPYDSTLLNGPYWNPVWQFKTTNPNDLVEEFIFKDLSDNVIISKYPNGGTVEISASELGLGYGSTLSFYVYTRNACGVINPARKSLIKSTIYYPTLCQYGIGQGCNLQRIANPTPTSYYKIFPNPSSNIINISLFDETITPSPQTLITAVLYDLKGQEKRSVTVVNNTASINVSSLKSGIYVLKIIIDGVTESHQVVVE